MHSGEEYCRHYRKKPDTKAEVIRNRCWEGRYENQTLPSWRGLLEFLELSVETSDGLGSKKGSVTRVLS